MSSSASLPEFAAALLDASRPVPAGVTSARGEADALRFAVYRNNVHVSLVEALNRIFPVTQALVGAEFFRAMTRVHVGENKPRDPVLIRYGADFPAFIERFPPAASLPYLADVARLELARNDAYHAADANTLSASDLAVLKPARLVSARFVPHPAARLVESRHAVGSIWNAHQDGTPARVEVGRTEAVLVTRPKLDLHMTILPARDVVFTRSLLAGDTLADAATRAEPDAAFDAGRALAGLLSLGAFAAIRDEHREHEA